MFDNLSRKIYNSAVSGPSTARFLQRILYLYIIFLSSVVLTLLAGYSRPSVLVDPLGIIFKPFSATLRTDTVQRTTTSTTSTTIAPKKNNNTAWCPKSRCNHQMNNHDDNTRTTSRQHCDVCFRRYLIVIAQGRSASTTLIEMLDLLPLVRMGGENMNILIRFKNDLQNVLETSAYGPSNETHAGAWKHHPMNTPHDWVCLGQSLVETIYPPPPPVSNSTYDDRVDDTNTILGFKTIRFAIEGGTVYNITDHVEYYRTMFPCARFIINIRSDADAMAESRQNAFGWKNMEKIKNTSQQEAAMLRQAAALFGNETAMLLDSSQWTQDVSYLNRAISWLGFDENCHFAQLLEFNTNDNYKATKSHLDANATAANVKCRYIGD